jgi:hypothetical protein
MKITKSRLKQIIKEELEQVMDESSMFGPYTTGPKPQRIRGRLPLDPKDEFEPPTDPAGDLYSIGAADDPGPDPAIGRMRARRASDQALGIDRRPISPEEAKAYAMLADQGFKYHNQKNRRIALYKTLDRGWDFSMQKASNILYSAANAGELDRDVVRNVLRDMGDDLRRRTVR